MPEHIKVLIVVLGLAIPAFLMAREPLIAAGYTEFTLRRHRAMWFGVTLVVFLSHSFWLSSLLCAMILYAAAAKDKAPLALYCMVLFAYPHFSQMIPGVGPIDNFFEVNHVRTLNLVILLPVAIALYRDKATRALRAPVPDFVLIGLMGLMFVSHAPDASVVGNFRHAFYLFVDIWIPYYVASRVVRKPEDFRKIAAGFLMAAVVVSLLAVFESVRHWLLYESLRHPLGLPPTLPLYLLRSEEGPLRANVSVGNAIVLGYVIMVGLGMYAALSDKLRPRWKGTAACCILVAGLAASFSRGPWVGVAALTLVMVVLGPGRGKRLTAALAFGAGILIFAMISPFGQRALDYLPFVGNVDHGSVDYRIRLFNVSMETFWQNPILGDTRYLESPNMEQMRQGQGIIDMVNTYLQFALPYGAVGLLLFVGALVVPMVSVWRAREAVIQTNPEAEKLGRALLATMIGILVTIGTVSSIGVIPTIYWLMAGLCISYARIIKTIPDGVRSNSKSRPGRSIVNVNTEKLRVRRGAARVGSGRVGEKQ